MANRFQTYTKQLLVDYNARSLAPYTLLDCICDTKKDDDVTGMNLIYDCINVDLASGLNTTSVTGLSSNQYLLVWDNTSSAVTSESKFRLLSLGSSSSGSASQPAEAVFGQDGQFHNRVKYADSLFNSDAGNSTGKYIPWLNVNGSDSQNMVYLSFPATNGEVQALVIDGEGKIGWGSAGAKLHYINSQSSGSDNTAYKLIATNITPGTNDVAPSTLFYDTAIYFKGGSLYHASDETLKTFIGDIDINLDNLSNIKKGMFYWKSDPDKFTNIGVTAQSVEALYPELVSTDKGLKSVDYSKLSVIALAAIDKLYARIQELEKQIDELKK